MSKSPPPLVYTPKTCGKIIENPKMEIDKTKFDKLLDKYIENLEKLSDNK